MRVIATNSEKECKESSDSLNPCIHICDKINSNTSLRDEKRDVSSKFRFHNAVSSTVNTLMAQNGYSRQRAITFLLQSIRGMNDPPSDFKVIEFMKKHGVGFDDAYRILTISEAIKSSCKEHALTASQAVDNLTSRLKCLRYIGRSSPTAHQPELKEVKDEFSSSEQSNLSSLRPLSVKETKKDLHRSTVPSRRKSNRKHTSLNNNIPTKHHKSRNSKKNFCTSHKQSSNSASTSFQSSFKAIGKLQSNEIQKDFPVTVSDRNTIVKKSKLNNVSKGPVDNSVSSINIKNISSPNNSSKRKRDRDRSQQHTNGADVSMGDGSPSTKIRRSSSP